MAFDEALPIAKQIAAALEAAHEQGVVHRDLKPANIKVRADGTVKVLDFGLAKAFDRAARRPGFGGPDELADHHFAGAGDRDRHDSGHRTYMSPEQARGKAVDKRADIWAFGCVLFEMLTGQPAFAGEGVSETLARVIEREPDWDTLPVSTPPPIRRLLKRCLQKDRKHRLDSAAAARFDVEEAMATAGQ